jgi:hypothetical protein
MSKNTEVRTMPSGAHGPGAHQTAKTYQASIVSLSEGEEFHRAIFGKGTDGASNVQGFASQEQMLQAMRDPRYRRDAAYRAEVTARLFWTK